MVPSENQITDKDIEGFVRDARTKNVREHLLCFEDLFEFIFKQLNLLISKG